VTIEAGKPQGLKCHVCFGSRVTRPIEVGGQLHSTGDSRSR